MRTYHFLTFLLGAFCVACQEAHSDGTFKYQVDAEFKQFLSAQNMTAQITGPRSITMNGKDSTVNSKAKNVDLNHAEINDSFQRRYGFREFQWESVEDTLMIKFSLGPFYRNETLVLKIFDDRYFPEYSDSHSQGPWDIKKPLLKLSDGLTGIYNSTLFGGELDFTFVNKNDSIRFQGWFIHVKAK